MVAKSRLTGTASQSLPNNAVTLVQWGGVDITGGFRGAGTPTHGFIVPAGVTRVDLHTFCTIQGSTAAVGVRFLRNSTMVALHQGGAGGSGVSDYIPMNATSVPVAENDTLTVHAFQNGGSARSLNGAGGEYYFEIRDAT